MIPGLDVARGVVLDGRYRIEDVLGQGGMATVYRARDEVLERYVAIKLFPPTPDAEEVMRHRAEMRVLAQLSHPNLVTLHDAGSAYAGGPMQQTYLVMELVAGPTLADLLATGPLTPRHAARVGLQLAEALAAVHAAGVVHRDIKPANVLLVTPEDEDRETLSTGPVVKIADFGIARLADGARLTSTGTTLGTATYLSPEQAAGAPIGPRTDVYALGLVLLECLTGVKAFTGTVVEVAAARLTSSPAIPTSLGASWCRLLEQMTRRSPDERLSMTEVAEALAPLAGRGRSRAVEVDEDGSGLTTAPLGSADPHEDPSADAELSTAAIEVTPVRTPAEPPAQTKRLEPLSALRAAGALPDDGREPRPAPVVSRPDRADGAGDAGARVRRWAAPAALLLALVVAVAVQVMRPDPTPSAPPPEYPAVEGPLGDALDDLVRSVTP